MPSATTAVNGDASQTAHAVTPGGTVTLALVSMSDVAECTFAFVAASDGRTSFPAITYTGFGAASFTMAAIAGGRGLSLLLETTVNPGRSNKTISRSLIGAAGTAGIIPLCPGETTERHATLGWLSALNDALGL